MKVVVCVDSFKGSLDTFESAKAIKEGVLEVYKDARVFVHRLLTVVKGLFLLL